MATSRGVPEVRRFIAQLPAAIEEKVLRGAARAAAHVVADEAKERLGGRRAEDGTGASVLIAEAVKVTTRRGNGVVVAKVILKGPGAYVGRWLEYGTAPHLITVSDSARDGRSVNRINQLAREGSLVIGDTFVGESVHHPGARAHPFLRVSLDVRERDAIAAAQSYIDAHVTRKGIVASSSPEGDDV